MYRIKIVTAASPDDRQRDTRWQIHELPEPETLAALGRVATRHGFLNHVLIRTIKTLRGMGHEEADRVYARWSFARLRDFVKECAAERLSAQAPATIELQEMLNE